MRPFRGNCQQVAIMECQLIASGKAWKVDEEDSIPLFKEQKTFQPKVIVSKYGVRTDTGKKFIPDIYSCKFVYNLTQDKGEVHMPRQVIDLLLLLMPEPLKSQLAELEDNGKETTQGGTN